MTRPCGRWSTGRVPLYRFVLSNVVGKYDLDRADGRIDALREGARLVSSIRDRSKVDAFARELTGMVGLDVEDARAEVKRATNRRPAPEPTTSGAGRPRRRRPPVRDLPSIGDPRFAVERETPSRHPAPDDDRAAQLRPES